MAFGDNFDCSVGHLYGGLIVNRVRWHQHAGGPSFCVGAPPDGDYTLQTLINSITTAPAAPLHACHPAAHTALPNR